MSALTDAAGLSAGIPQDPALAREEMAGFLGR
jgi:hypothetical protein